MRKFSYVLFITIALASCQESGNSNVNQLQKADTEQNSISEIQKQNLIELLASELHEEWRNNRRLSDGSYNPRIKKTTDSIWINRNDTAEVDIANTPFPELPADWQKENLEASRVAMGEVISAYENGIKLDSIFIEEASEQVHVEWLARNKEWAEEDQKLPYEQLSEDEKEKDRMQVRKAIEVFKQRR